MSRRAAAVAAAAKIVQETRSSSRKTATTMAAEVADQAVPVTSRPSRKSPVAEEEKKATKQPKPVATKLPLMKAEELNLSKSDTNDEEEEEEIAVEKSDGKRTRSSNAANKKAATQKEENREDETSPVKRLTRNTNNKSGKMEQESSSSKLAAVESSGKKPQPKKDQSEDSIMLPDLSLGLGVKTKAASSAKTANKKTKAATVNKIEHDNKDENPITSQTNSEKSTTKSKANGKPLVSTRSQKEEILEKEEKPMTNGKPASNTNGNIESVALSSVRSRRGASSTEQKKETEVKATTTRGAKKTSGESKSTNNSQVSNSSEKENVDSKATANGVGAARATRNGAKPVKVAIEHCKSWTVYGRMATRLIDALRVDFPHFEFAMNEEKPRRLAFEITLVLDDGERIELWSGIDKAPRKAKFPEHGFIIDEIKKHI